MARSEVGKAAEWLFIYLVLCAIYEFFTGKKV